MAIRDWELDWQALCEGWLRIAEIEPVLMAVLLVICLIAAGIKALFRLLTGTARREQEEEQLRWDERRKEEEEEERKRQEELRRRAEESARKQFEAAIMDGRYPAEQVLAMLAECDRDMPVNLKEALEEMLYGSCTLHPMAFGDAVCLIQQRQRVSLLRWFDVRVGLFDTALSEFCLHFRLLSCQQIDLGLKRTVARQFDLDLVLSWADQHRM